MNNFEMEYRKSQELEKQYYAAETAGDEVGMNAAKEAYQAHDMEMQGKGDIFYAVYGWYVGTVKRGNEHIEIPSGSIEENEAKMITDVFRTNGIKQFTISCNFTDGGRTAWNFQQNGCKLEEIVEINGQTKKWLSNEYEKVYAYLFSVC